MSLKIEKKDGAPTFLALEGRLDTVTAADFEKEIGALLSQNDSLTLDFEKLEYISSAGLRVVLKAQKALAPKNGLKLIKVTKAVKEIFDITGFSDFLVIE
ncbi:MAG: STAS domain-containing protein [Clostridia bacterium]|nr:STAS domain-containing protein [Clostridia bacterium]